jgi:hypothetical protein
MAKEKQPEQKLYRVRMWESDPEQGDMGPTTEVVVQLTDLEGHWFADFRQGSWSYANLALLRGLAERGLRLVCSLPDFDPQRKAEEKTFWIVVESE